MGKNEKEEEKKDDKKQMGHEPFIIRREVILKDDKNKKSTQIETKKPDTRSDLGKVQKKSINQDYNIVYRDKKEKPLSVSELFGLKPKKEEKKEVEKEVKKEIKKEIEKGFVIKTTSKSSRFDKPQEKRTNLDKTSQFKTRNFNDDFKKDKTKQYKKDGKSIQQKVDIDLTQFKDNDFEREKQGKQKDRQRELKQEERKPKVRKYSDEFEEIDDAKLEALRRTTNLSKMFESGQMLDYYDISFKNRRKSTQSKKQKQLKKKELEDASKLEKIVIPEIISVKDFSQTVKKTSAEVLKKLMDYGIMTTINSSIDFDTAYLIAQEFGIEAEKKVEVSFEEKLFDDSEDKEEDLKERPPVVVVMGHVDHR